MTESEFALDAGFCANPTGFAERQDKTKSE